MPGFEDYNENNASKRLESDKNDHGYQLLNDEEITNTVAEGERPPTMITKTTKVKTSLMRHPPDLHTSMLQLVGNSNVLAVKAALMLYYPCLLYTSRCV